MSQHQNVVDGGGGIAIAGWAVNLLVWLTGGMSPLAVLATLLTIALTVLKLYDAIQRKRKDKPLDSAVAPLVD